MTTPPAAARPAPGQTTCPEAHRLALYTRADVEREFHDARQGWSMGTDYLCPFCGSHFCSVSGARKHAKAQRHIVLRWDWYSDLPALANQGARR